MSSAGTEVTAASVALGVDAENARSADINVKVVDKARDEKTFECTVSSPWLDDRREPQPEDWVLPVRTGELVRTYMESFARPESDAPSRVLALEGAGMDLWPLAPEGLKETIAGLVGADRAIETIQIVSDEPNIPWELMVPDDDDARPLGVRHTLARWFVGTEPLRATGTPAGDARVAAPLSDPPPARLAMAAKEATLVCDKLAGHKLETPSAIEVKRQLEAWRGTVLHFVCHGEGGPPQELRLDGTERLSSLHVAAMRGLRTAWCASAPVVFLNACKAGLSTPTLEGAGGLPRSWAKVGAGAVIAPLWSVRDEIAHEVAVEFYERIATEPQTPYAEIVRDIRARAYTEQEDSFAAYCYFGSPWAAAEPIVSGSGLSIPDPR